MGQYVLNERNFFINNCFGAFFRGVLEWMGDDFYPRFKFRVIATYDKAIQYFTEQIALGKEVDGNILPSITLDPQLDFSQEERGGKFLWQTYYLNPGLAIKLFNPIDLVEQDTLITPVFSRYEGTFSTIFWLSSVYELLDFRTMLLQFTGGYGRYIRPKLFWSFIELPTNIKDYQMDGVPLDWSNTLGTFRMIKNIAQERFTYPVLLNPMFKLESLNDDSTKMGADQIAEYKLSATWKYELELPTYMVLTSKIGGSVNLNFSMTKMYTKYNYQSPYTLLKEIASTESRILPYLKNLRQFELVDHSKTPILDSSTCTIFPEVNSMVVWNPIVSGNLVRLIDSDIVVTKDDIILIDEFDQNLLPHIRNCKAVISRIGNYTSTLYSKCSLLNKPLISSIGSDINLLTPYIGQSITMDVLHRKIYSGVLETREVLSTEPQFGYDLLNYLKKTNKDMVDTAIANTASKNPINREMNTGVDRQKILIGIADGVNNIFNVSSPTSLGDVTVYIGTEFTNCYTIDINSNSIVFNVAPPKDSMIFILGPKIVGRETKLLAMYEYDTNDEKNDFVDMIFNVDVEAKDLILNSYLGIMRLGRDWELDNVNHILKLKIKPKSGEVVEIFRIY